MHLWSLNPLLACSRSVKSCGRGRSGRKNRATVRKLVGKSARQSEFTDLVGSADIRRLISKNPQPDSPSFRPRPTNFEHIFSLKKFILKKCLTCNNYHAIVNVALKIVAE